jgi:putative tricarboxylic transport membrane protein
MMDKRDLVGCAVWLILSVFVFTASLRLGVGALRSPGPGFIPFWASIGLAFFACILLGFNLTQKTQAVCRENGAKDSGRKNHLIIIAVLTIYCLALEKLGYLLTTFGLMMVLFRLGKMKPWAIIIGSLVTSLSSYGLFAYFLGTPLPRGIFGF